MRMLAMWCSFYLYSADAKINPTCTFSAGAGHQHTAGRKARAQPGHGRICAARNRPYSKHDCPGQPQLATRLGLGKQDSLIFTMDDF